MHVYYGNNIRNNKYIENHRDSYDKPLSLRNTMNTAGGLRSPSGVSCSRTAVVSDTVVQLY